MKDQYDYIVVGAGSAGCALANRLSADPDYSVLLIESGPPDTNPFIHMPRGIGVILNPGSKVIWEHQVETGGNRPPERWYRGKTLGGSSSVNGMIYMRGSPMDYDSWQAMGCTGWGWSEVERKFIELENHDLGAGPSRGTGGEQRITTHPKGEPLFEAIIEAGVEMGIPRVEDVNAPQSTRDGGIGYQTTTRFGGQRFSAAKAFLAPIKDRANLDILTNADVLRVAFEGKRAAGVEVRTKDGTRTIAAKREIILSAGAFHSPKLLQLSGIGPRALLEQFGIEVIADAPGVGGNLREHRHVDAIFKVRDGSSNKALGGWRAITSTLRYFLSKSGPMTHAAHEVGGFAKSSPDVGRADLQFGLMTVSTVTAPDDSGKIALAPYPGITFVTYFTRPESRGEVHITSADPDAPVAINVNHLSAEIDREKFVAAFRWNRRLASQPALRDWIVEETGPGAKLEREEDILTNAMELGGTCFHNSGTARMGSDEDSVVDPQLRVRGVDGLRVADTSIFPTLVSGNTNGPAMMTGLRAADFIIADRS